jgi:hypothetical protein
LNVGLLQIDHGDLGEAQTRLQRLLTLAKAEDQALYKYWALVGLGDVRRAQGDLAGALKSYRTASPSGTGWPNPIPATPAGSAISR